MCVVMLCFTFSCGTLQKLPINFIFHSPFPSSLESFPPPSFPPSLLLRNYAVKEDLSHVCISEYERVSETSRGRARFFHGQRDLMFYTGRAHYFKRYMMRGASHLIFYSLPENAKFYPELVNLLEEAGGGGGREGGRVGEGVTSVFAMFTRFEALALERIVGTARAKHMLGSEKATFLFC